MIKYSQLYLQIRDMLLDFFQGAQICIIGFFVLFKFENELEMIISDISFNSVYPWQIYKCNQNLFGWQRFPILT